MKGVGALMVMVAAVALARLMGRPYRLRVRALEAWQACLARLEPEIGWRQLPIRQALARAAASDPLFKPVLARLNTVLDGQEGGFGDAFGRALEEMPGLWAEDREPLTRLGRTLGESAAGYQEGHIGMARGEVERLLAAARDGGLKQAKLVETLVALGGVAVVIALM